MQTVIIMMLCGLMSFYSFSLCAEESASLIQNAAKENKYLFMFFYKDQNEKTARLQTVFDQAMQKMGSQVKSLKVKVDDLSERSLIERFNLKRSPMPFVIVLAPNGAITGGFPLFSVEQLVDSVASSGAACCLKALQDRKLVLLSLQNSKTANNEAALKGMNEFKEDPSFAGAIEIVMVDPANKLEHKFLDQLALDLHSDQAITVFISPPAEVIGTYLGPITKAQLVSDLKKATSGCCGPGGCCPGGKCGTK